MLQQLYKFEYTVILKTYTRVYLAITGFSKIYINLPRKPRMETIICIIINDIVIKILNSLETI